MERRQFITSGLYGMSVIALASALPACRPHGAAAVEPLEGLLDANALAVLQSLRGTTLIGQAWLAGHAQTALDRPVMERRLLDHIETDEPANAARQHFSERLAASVSRDFDTGRIREIEGWILSESECLAAATRVLVFGENEPVGETEWRDGTLVQVDNWGPQGTSQGAGVNVQPDGHVGLWFQIANAPSWLRIEIDGVSTPTVTTEQLITSGLYGELRDRIIGTPGAYTVAIIDPMQRIRQRIGVFTVTAPPPYLTRADGSTSTFCAVEAWGPDGNQTHRPVNPQPDGHDGLWFRVSCAPDSVQVLFDGDPLATTNDRASSLVTALIPPSHYAVARDARIQLHDPDTGEVLDVGIFHVRD